MGLRRGPGERRPIALLMFYSELENIRVRGHSGEVGSERAHETLTKISGCDRQGHS